MTKSDCINYDWGDTCPREYGAFCKLTKRTLREDTCEKCDKYQPKVKRKPPVKKIIVEFENGSTEEYLTDVLLIELKEYGQFYGKNISVENIDEAMESLKWLKKQIFHRAVKYSK